ncbi:MauE/DoxX family redox-associated membrane protein [Chryseobacterium sp.]|uniref:MauE/DoxX family redox-associated membrane protein n=1 Tax=Chryseobacterium sp. TaxID=1871047 RepID=UPI002FC8E96A
METFKTRFVEIVSYFFILLFCYATISKIMDFENFNLQLSQSPLLGVFAELMVYAVLTLELLICVLLIFERTRTLGLYFSFTIMVLFTAYIYIILHYSEFVPCSCGGILEKMDWNTHLIFNIVAVVLAGSALLIQNKIQNSNILRISGLLVLISVISILSLVALHQRSEYILHRENNFTRRFLKHPLDLDKRFDLKYNSYYFAGATKDSVYLGNTTTPFRLFSIDYNLTAINEQRITPDRYDFTFKSPKINVQYPRYYLYDGTVPVIYAGEKGKSNVQTISYKQTYFTQLRNLSPDSFAAVRYSGEKAIQTLGLVLPLQEKPVIEKPNLLEKVNDGVFDTDGKLLFDDTSKKVVYVYTYKNKFIVLDQHLENSKSYKTIDDITIPDIQVVQLKTGEKKMKNPPLIVNRSATVHCGVLFIESPRLGKNENKLQKGKSITIDMYAIGEQKYLGSFYLPTIEESKFNEFWISGNHLYTLIGNELFRYRLAQNITQHFIQEKPKT